MTVAANTAAVIGITRFRSIARSAGHHASKVAAGALMIVACGSTADAVLISASTNAVAVDTAIVTASAAVIGIVIATATETGMAGGTATITILGLLAETGMAEDGSVAAPASTQTAISAATTSA